jgi:hypothetical protein
MSSMNRVCITVELLWQGFRLFISKILSIQYVFIIWCESTNKMHNDEHDFVQLFFTSKYKPLKLYYEPRNSSKSIILTSLLFKTIIIIINLINTLVVKSISSQMNDSYRHVVLVQLQPSLLKTMLKSWLPYHDSFFADSENMTAKKNNDEMWLLFYLFK